MDDAALLLRIRVIAVSTRAAVRSLGPNDTDIATVVARGTSLLDNIAPMAGEDASRGVRDAYDRARSELESMDRPRSMAEQGEDVAS